MAVWIRQPKELNIKRLLGLLLVMGIVGCGGGDEPTPQRIESAKSTTRPDHYLVEGPLTALELLDARITKDDQGQVIHVDLGRSQVTDAELVHLKSLDCDYHIFPKSGAKS